MKYTPLDQIKTEQLDNVTHIVYGVPRLKFNNTHYMGSQLEVSAITGIPKPNNYTYDAICISISPGCFNTPGCLYCATGELSYQLRITQNKVLTTEDILAQIILTKEYMQKNNLEFGKELSIAFMGKGEPGLYPELIMNSLNIGYDAKLFSKSSISTTGNPVWIKKLTQTYDSLGKLTDFELPALQISIQSPLDSQRYELVSNPKALAPLEEVLKTAVENYAMHKRGSKKVSLRYTLMDNNGKKNFSEKIIDEFGKKIIKLNEQYEPQGFEGFMIIVANLNETTYSQARNIKTATDEDVDNAIKQLKKKRIKCKSFFTKKRISIYLWNFRRK